MTTTENSRADALIDERIEDAIYRHIPPKIALENAKALYAMAVELLVASPVEQFAPSPLTERDYDLHEHEQGLYRKFDVRRVDGSSEPGGKHHDCEYFVLDMTHDQHARAALRAYADACASTHPELSADLIARYALAPIEQPAAAPIPKLHCQNSGDVCLAGNRDGVCCPEDSCDIDDGVRKDPRMAQPAPSPADERTASWYCCDPVQICSAQCDSCAKQARAALKAIVDERAECIAWANANGFTKYHESMCAAWEERARRAAQQLSTEIGELKAKLVSYELEREDQIRYLAAQSEEIADLKQQLAHADARVGLTAEARATIMDACQSISRRADEIKESNASADGTWCDADEKAFYYAELSLLERLVSLLATTQQPRAEVTDAARDVLDERHRQIDAEGWTPAHDDEHDECEMALAAIVYTESAVGYHPSCPDTWPWSPKWFKPTTPRRDLVKAAALVIAEIERLDRAATRTGASS